MDLEAKIAAMLGKTPTVKRSPGRMSFQFPWLHNEPKVWKLYLPHFMAEVRPAPYDYHGPQRWMVNIWAGGSDGSTNVHKVDMKLRTSAAARKKAEAYYRKLARMKSWLLDLPIGPALVEGGKRRHGHGGRR